MNKDKNKYSLVTGEKKKEKSLKKIKKEHKHKEKIDLKENKKLEKEKRHVARKLKTEKQKQLEILDASKIEGTLVGGDDAEQKVETATVTSGQTALIVRRKKEKPLSFKRKVLNFISYALVALIAVGFGYIAGNFYFANYMNKIDYSKYSVSALRDDGASVYAAASRKGVALSNAVEAFVAAEYLLDNTLNYTAAGYGEVQPSIGSKQMVRGLKIRTGDTYYGENYSKGMISMAEYYTYDSNTKVSKLYRVEGANAKWDGAIFPENPTTIFNTYEEYTDEYGASPDHPVIPYIISSKTYIEGSDSVRSLGGGKYQLTFSLQKDTSVINYVKQMKHMSGLPSYPTFKSLTITAVVNQNFVLEKLRIDETYTVVYFGVPATCVGYYEQTITY